MQYIAVTASTGTRIIDPASLSELQNLADGYSWAAAFSHHGEYLAVGTQMGGVVSLWSSPPACASIKRINVRSNEVYAFHFSPSDEKLIAGTQESTCTIYSVPSLDPMVTLPGHTNGLLSVLFLTETIAATGGWDRSMHVWDVSTGSSIKFSREHRDIVRMFVLSPDGALFASCCGDRSLRVFETEAPFNCIFAIPCAGSVRSACFADSDTILVGLDGHDMVHVDVKTGRIIRTYRAHRDLTGIVILRPARKSPLLCALAHVHL